MSPFDDPSFNITWPIEPTVLSEKDKAWGKLSDRISELDTGLKSTKI